MPLVPGTSREAVQNNVKEITKLAKPHAPKSASPVKLATGGLPSSSEMAPWYTRDEERGMVHNGGLFGGATGGRTDNLPLNVPAGSHVIPADVVSGLGEGNTLAGAAVLERMLHTGPGGMRLDSPRGHNTIPHAPTAYRPPTEKLARGGTTHGHTRVPIIGAAGEFLVHPNAVKHIGGGNPKKGHAALDAFIKHIREKTAKKMLSLPGPRK